MWHKAESLQHEEGIKLITHSRGYSHRSLHHLEELMFEALMNVNRIIYERVLLQNKYTKGINDLLK